MIHQILAITWKDLKILFKETGSLATLFLMPAMFIFITSLALGGLYDDGGDGLVQILVVNEDAGPAGAQIVAELTAAEGIRVQTEWDGMPLTRARAEQLIAGQQRNLAVVIPADFSQAVQRRLAGPDAGESTPAAQIELVVDPALSQQFIGPVRGALAGLSQQAVLMTVVSPRSIDLLLDEIGRATGQPVSFETRQRLQEQTLLPWGEAAGNGPGALVEIRQTQPAGMQIERLPNVVQQNVPGWALFGVFFISQVLAASMREEKIQGSFRRLLVAPMSRTALLLGKLVPYVLVSLMQIAVMFAVGVFVMPLFGAPRLELGPHPAGLALISVATALVATGLGLMVAALATSPDQIGGLLSLLVVTMAALGGVMVPRFIMPEFMQMLGLITPHAWALTAYQDVLVRGYGVVDILPEFGVLLGFAAVFFGVAVWRFNWEG